MSKTLLLFRHGKANAEGYDRDWDRELKHRGEVQARHIGKVLKKKQLIPERIIASSAARAQATAELAAEAMDFTGELEITDQLYNIHTSRLVKMIEELDDGDGVVMLVGHNPAFEEAASVLAARSMGLGTGDCALLQYAVDSWSELVKSQEPEAIDLIKSD